MSALSIFETADSISSVSTWLRASLFAVGAAALSAATTSMAPSSSTICVRSNRTYSRLSSVPLPTGAASHNFPDFSSSSRTKPPMATSASHVSRISRTSSSTACSQSSPAPPSSTMRAERTRSMPPISLKACPTVRVCSPDGSPSSQVNTKRNRAVSGCGLRSVKLSMASTARGADTKNCSRSVAPDIQANPRLPRAVSSIGSSIFQFELINAFKRGTTDPFLSMSSSLVSFPALFSPAYS